MSLVISIAKTVNFQDYENRIQSLQEQVERHSMISSVATASNLFDDDDDDDDVVEGLYEEETSVLNSVGSSFILSDHRTSIDAGAFYRPVHPVKLVGA